MSVRVMSAVWELDLPPMEKLVLLALADCANDEGHCWPSATTLARKTGEGERTVRRAVQSLIAKGHLDQKQRSGTSPVYTVNPCQSGTPARAAPLPDRPDTPARAAPKPLGTIIPKKDKPSLDKPARSKPAHRLPKDWEPEPFLPGTVAFDIVQAWEPGRIERELSKFRDHWAAASGQTARKHDWQAAWRTWINKADEWGGRNGSANRGSGGRMGGPGPDTTLELVRSANQAIARGAEDYRGAGPALPPGQPH